MTNNPQQTQREMLEKHVSTIEDPVDRAHYKLSISHGFDLGWKAAQQAMPVPTEAEIESAADPSSDPYMQIGFKAGVDWLLAYQAQVTTSLPKEPHGTNPKAISNRDHS